jgi:hypothetical protein
MSTNTLDTYINNFWRTSEPSHPHEKRSLERLARDVKNPLVSVEARIRLAKGHAQLGHYQNAAFDLSRVLSIIRKKFPDISYKTRAVFLRHSADWFASDGFYDEAACKLLWLVEAQMRQEPPVEKRVVMHTYETALRFAQQASYPLFNHEFAQIVRKEYEQFVA